MVTFGERWLGEAVAFARPDDLPRVGVKESIAYRKPAAPEAVQFEPIYSSRKKSAGVTHLCGLVSELVCLSGNAGEICSPPVPQSSVFLRRVANVVSDLEPNSADTAQRAVLPKAQRSLKPSCMPIGNDMSLVT